MQFVQTETSSRAQRGFVLDDDRQFGAGLGMMLSKLGLAPLPIDHVSDLLAGAPGREDWIFVDLAMPDLDGVQVLHELAAATVRARIALVSGYGSDVLQAASRIGSELGLNMAGTLCKPFRLSQLRSMLKVSAARPASAAGGLAPPPASRDDIAEGLERGEFGVLLQPIVDLGSGELAACEALVRWFSQRHGLVMPSQFLAPARQHGLISRITDVVAALVIRQAKGLRAVRPDARLSFDVDAFDLADRTLPDRLAEASERLAVAPGALIIEVDQSSANSGELSLLQSLTRLRIRGFNLAIDGFTATSSSTRLARELFMAVKIDKRLVGEIEGSRRARAAVRSAIVQARRSGLVAIAEEVETDGQLELLHEMGCDMAQGPLVAEPMPLSDLLAWLARGRSAAPSNVVALPVAPPAETAPHQWTVRALRSAS